MSYYVEFTGELKDNRMVQKRFMKQYNQVCNIVNEHIPSWNEEFDNNWTGQPIEDYFECREYNEWMLSKHKEALLDYEMKKDLFLEYDYDDDLQLYAIGRWGLIKNQKISFIIREGA